MNQTDELRRMLNECGIEYTMDDSVRGELFTVLVEPRKRVYIETWDKGGMAIWGGTITAEQAINATLGDGEYEAKMDALLSLLTNGKFSKSRSYSLNFMETCVNEEFESLLAEEMAEADERIKELEALVRDMAGFIDGIINRDYTVNVAHGADLIVRAERLGIEVDDAG